METEIVPGVEIPDFDKGVLYYFKLHCAPKGKRGQMVKIGLCNYDQEVYRIFRTDRELQLRGLERDLEIFGIDTKRPISDEALQAGYDGVFFPKTGDAD